MAKAMRYFICTVTRETEKAILTEHYVGFNHFTGEDYMQSAWLPKSQIQEYKRFLKGDKAVIYKVPLWLCKKNGLKTITKKIADKVYDDEVEGIDYVMA